jgi:NTE family protein
MRKNVVLLLQGGGALSPFIRGNGHRLIAVAGASIGAINAALVARHYHDADCGSGMLLDFWRNQLATPPVPFFPFAGEYWRAWNGLLTGLLLGNRRLFYPAYQYWNPLGDMFRFHMPMYQTDIAEHTLEAIFGEYHGAQPLLAVGLTEVKTGEGILLNSMKQTITPRMLAASIAIPLLFPPVEIDGRHYWDYEMRCNTLLPDVIALLSKTMPQSGTSEGLLVIAVDMLRPDADRIPTSAIESHYRLINILLGAKLKYDQRAFEAGNTYWEAMGRLHRLAGNESNSPLTAAIEEEYQKVLAERPVHVEFLHIGRRTFENEYISRDFDYSPCYIERLIVQGFENASNAIRNYQERHHSA